MPWARDLLGDEKGDATKGGEEVKLEAENIIFSGLLLPICYPTAEFPPRDQRSKFAACSLSAHTAPLRLQMKGKTSYEKSWLMPLTVWVPLPTWTLFQHSVWTATSWPSKTRRISWVGLSISVVSLYIWPYITLFPLSFPASLIWSEKKYSL